MQATTIPPMTHPLSRAWNQPPASEILLDGAHALMERHILVIDRKAP